MRKYPIIHYTLLCAFSILLTVSCVGLSGLLDDTETTSPTSTTQSVSFSPDKQNKTVTLNGLKAAIDNTVGSASWVTATPQSYVSGSPTIIISVTANTTTNTRSNTVTITDTKKNTVTLTITQEGIKNGIGDIHNTDTDQPAYAPRR